MKTEKQIRELYELFNKLNDSYIFNQDYRKGIMDGLFFVMSYSKHTKLDRFIDIMNLQGEKDEQ